jgi:heme-degrading monooxygenase HmoA
VKKKKRAKKIDEAIRLTWSSLESHLKWTHHRLPKNNVDKGESNGFHRNCVKEYARTIQILSELY